MVGWFLNPNHGLGLKIAGRQNIYILEVRCFLDALPFGGSTRKLHNIKTARFYGRVFFKPKPRFGFKKLKSFFLSSTKV
jgi:hypothetical protein